MSKNQKLTKPDRFSEFRDFIQNHNRFLLVTHMGPDGDGLLSCLAFALYLIEKGGSATVVTEDEIPDFVSFFNIGKTVMSSCDLLKQKNWEKNFDSVILLDAGKLSRLGKLEDPVSLSSLPITIMDHHIPENDDPDYPKIIDENASSIGELLAEFLDEEKYDFKNLKLIRLLYAAIVYDTGQFRFSNTTNKTLKWAKRFVELGVDPGEAYSIFWESNGIGSVKLLAKLMSELKILCNDRLASFKLTRNDLKKFGVKKEETDEFISVPRGISSIEVVVFCSELENGKIRVSLRSKGKVEIHDVAIKFGGGGHAFAAGVRMRGPIEKAEEKILSALSDKIKETLD
ncbi:MAG: DHH family phosphoesterase [Nitrospinota bacterium]|nr:DHH family phosphoesterase [Nitrospinota bacterium]